MEINKNLQLEINQVSVFLLAFFKKNLFQWKPYFIFVPSNFTDDNKEWLKPSSNKLGQEDDDVSERQ